MWIGVQIVIFITLVGISLFLPEKVYGAILAIGVIFTIFAVFANWLLVIQIINILLSGGIGFTIIEKRDKLFKNMSNGILRVDHKGNRLKAKDGSTAMRVTLVCAVIIMVLYCWNFYFINGEFVSYFISPLELMGYYNFLDIIKYIDIFGGALLLYYAWTYRSHGIEFF